MHIELKPALLTLPLFRVSTTTFNLVRYNKQRTGDGDPSGDCDVIVNNSRDYFCGSITKLFCSSRT